MPVSRIGVIAAMSMASFAKARRQAQEKAFVEDLRTIEDAILEYAQDYGHYPADTQSKVMPTELIPYLQGLVDWSKPTPIGG